MSEQNLGYSNPDEIFYSDSTINQKLTYLHGLRNSLEDEVQDLWEHEDQWIKSIADLKMNKIDLRTDLEFLLDEMNGVNNEGIDLQNKAKQIQKRIKNEYNQAPITESKHFKIIVAILSVIFALCLISFYFFIAFVVVSCGYFIFVFRNYLVDKKEKEVKEKEKNLLEEQLALLKKQLEEKVTLLNSYKEEKESMESKIKTLTEEHEGIQSKLSRYKEKRNDLEKTKQYLTILNQFNS
ncbi:coiled-coil domain-containing protein [Haloplasma contractile]|uniref:Uncharacterized protein n=1 Tax=Haloplasma contractile SSD-17B TaxID=1033810 RepID=U2EAU2_9MOLU|nr:hypothetical protein [Haloplasma contractile]ERJ11931.1 hypothetical protein HLPCO_001845 [Haloplasma contractile SSD-17B]